MTPAQAKELLPVFTAFSEGKAIQFKDDGGKWLTASNLEFTYPPARYRIRPEPRWRPWAIAEINQLPVDTIFKQGTDIGVIAFILGGIVTIRGPKPADCVTVYDLLNDWTHSPDHGQTWKKCGVEIGDGT